MRQRWNHTARHLAWLHLPGLLLLLAAPVRAGEPGSVGFLSLRFGTGARYAGMGDVGVSLARDASAVYWNPAGLSAIKTTSLELQHNEWLQSLRAETAALAHATDLGVFGLYFSGMYLDNIERTTSASSTPEGTFNVYEIAVQGAYGRSLTHSEKLGDLDVGLAFKGLFSGLDNDTASGWAFDVGAHLRTQIPGLTFGAAGQHLGPDITFIEDHSPLPATLRVGADYQRSVQEYRSDFAVAYDLEVVNDDDLRNHFGVEWTYAQLISLRGGFKTGFDSQKNGCFGVGVQRGGYHFDYAFTGVDNDLGNVHRFSIGIDL